MPLSFDQQGRALSYQTGKVGHALPKRTCPFSPIRQSRARPFKRGTPFLIKSDKVRHVLPKGAAPFPIYQTVCQELRMDGGIAKPEPAYTVEPERDSSPILSFSLPTFPVRSGSGARFVHV